MSELVVKQFTFILGFEIVGELANMAVFHEANHLGQIQARQKSSNMRKGKAFLQFVETSFHL